MTARESNQIALNPVNSVVIEACAGSGKTWLLVSRIIRLLLDGTAPSSILAITFTRKAQQEMALRLHEWLHFLATASENDVKQFLLDREIATGKLDELLPRARCLFELTLAAQPEMTIATFHGWFMQILQRAPLASGAVGNVTLVERTSNLLDEAWDNFAEELQNTPESEEARAINFLFSEYGLSSTRQLMRNFVEKRAEWWAYTFGQRQPLTFALNQLLKELAIDPNEDVRSSLLTEAILQDLCAYSGFLSRNTPSDIERAKDLDGALVGQNSLQRFDSICKILFTADGKNRARESNKTQRSRLGMDDEQRFLALHESLCAAFNNIKDALARQELYRLNAAGLRCGISLLAHYQHLKNAHQVIDFTDIEWRTRQLLINSEHAEYMQYKLDSRYKHILLDEFQDTNPLQWQVLQSWLDAANATHLPPTLFMVGDPKQSIFRFRRAEARLFTIAGDFLIKEYGGKRIRQNISRRCAPAIIDAVNAVFSKLPDYAFEPHESYNAALWSKVAVLPLCKNDQPENIVETKIEEDVDIPEAANDAESLRDPLSEPLMEEDDQRYRQEAQELSLKIHELVGTYVIADKNGIQRPAEFRDIMILVHRRTHLEMYEMALKAADIPYVSTRQGGLLETLECSDIIALLQFLISPFDDLALAQALRSPIFSCSDEDLMQIARVAGASWWDRLRTLASGQQLPGRGPVKPQLALPLDYTASVEYQTSAALRQAFEMLEHWQALIDTLPVHDLLDRIYFESDLLARYTQSVPATLSESVKHNLQAFIELALNVDSGRYPSLPHFLSEIEQLKQAANEESPDERTLVEIGNAVRILTIHGAKGLEAPIVFLLDAHCAPRNDPGYGTLINWPPEQERPIHFSLTRSRSLQVKALEDHLQQQQIEQNREHLNLLYVAMTRAQQLLFISGCDVKRNSQRKEKDSTWYDRVAEALSDVNAQESGANIVQSFNGLCEEAPTLARGSMPLPNNKRHALHKTAALPAPPSINPAIGQREATLSDARRHGIYLHLLLEKLSMLDDHSDHSKALLQDQLGISSAEFEQLWQEARAIMEARDLQKFFDRNSYLLAYNELPYITGGGELRRIDRIVEFEDSVWLLDYKRTASEDMDAQKISAAYLNQLREYRSAMSTVYTNKPIHCALIFRGGKMIEVA